MVDLMHPLFIVPLFTIKYLLSQGLKAPWDSKGRPLGSISTLGKDSKK